MSPSAPAGTRYELYLKTIPHRIGSETVRWERLFVALRALPAFPYFEAIVDPGAYLSVIPPKVWKPLEQRRQITWLKPADEAALPKWCRGFGGVAGGAIACRLGSVEFSVVGLSSPPIISPPFPIWALFAQSDGSISQTLFGLGGGTFGRHQFNLEESQGRAALIEI